MSYHLANSWLVKKLVRIVRKSKAFSKKLQALWLRKSVGSTIENENNSVYIVFYFLVLIIIVDTLTYLMCLCFCLYISLKVEKAYAH